MALRIGAILLASCQLISGSVVSVGNINHINLNPLRPIEQDSHHRVQAGSVSHVVVGNLKWTSPRQKPPKQAFSSQDKSGQKELTGGRWASPGHRVDRKRASSGVKVDSSHKFEVISPKPSVIVSGYVIGQNAVKGHTVQVESDHIDVNKTPVKFGSLKYVQNDSDHGQVAKAPITVVTVPQISTAKTTQHKVATNQVINRSNIPSVKDKTNRSADKLLFNYNNLLSTKIQPITAVSQFRISQTPQKVRSELVRPGKLEKVVAAQLALGQRHENAPISINQFVTTRVEQYSEQNQECESNDDHSPNHKHRVVIGLGY